eukprot:3122474-Rhodomonas_salina.1
MSILDEAKTGHEILRMGNMVEEEIGPEEGLCAAENRQFVALDINLQARRHPSESPRASSPIGTQHSALAPLSC